MIAKVSNIRALVTQRPPFRIDGLYRGSIRRPWVIALVFCPFPAASASAQAADDPLVVERGDSIVIRMADTSARLAVQTLARYLDQPVVFGPIGDQPVTLETPAPVPISRVPAILQTLLETHGLAMSEQDGVYRIGPAEPPPREAAPAPPQAQAQQLFVIRVRHARAPDVASTVNALFGIAAAFGETGVQDPTLDASLRESLVPPQNASESGGAVPVTSIAARLSGDVAIVPDPRTNSLLVRATRRDFELIQAAVDQLDVRPLQVLIEVLIVEVREDVSRGLGLETILPEQPIPGGSGGTVAASAGGSATLGDLVIRIMNLGERDLSLLLGAGATSGDVEIVSRPVVLAANNEQASILVGSQRPFVQVQRTLPTEAAVRDQVVQFRDVGTRLSVTPTISDDGYVMLQVAQEVNAATAEVAFDAPVISTRTIQTQLLVRDGHTAVLGGLTDRQYDIARQGVPFLSSIPLIGALFGSQMRREVNTELFVFLTPRVIRSDTDLDEAADGAGRRTRELREQSEQAIPPRTESPRTLRGQASRSFDLPQRSTTRVQPLLLASPRVHRLVPGA